jgi:hypothetical protein
MRKHIFSTSDKKYVLCSDIMEAQFNSQEHKSKACKLPKKLHKCTFHLISLFAGLKKQSHEIHEVKTSGHSPHSWSSSASPPGRQSLSISCWQSLSISSWQSLSISSWQSLCISSWQRHLQGRQRFLILLHFSGSQSLPEQQSAGYCRLRQSALRQEKGLQGDYDGGFKKVTLSPCFFTL